MNQNEKNDDFYKTSNLSQDFELGGMVKVTGELDQNNTLANLLMYESEYVAKPGADPSTSDMYPVYYEDNTANHDKESYSEESEDMLYNFLLKLVNALAFRIRILQRGCFESIFCYRHPHKIPKKEPLDLL